MRIDLLGPLRVADDADVAVHVPGARLRVLLATLALNADKPVTGDTLAECVWDGLPPPGYATTLRSHVMRLRRALPAARIETLDTGYLLSAEGLGLDLAHFEALCRHAGASLRVGAWAQADEAAGRALGLWRGEPLADVPSQVLRDRVVPNLEQLRVQVLEDHAEAGLALRRHGQMVEPLRDLVAQYPLRERLHAQLMIALSRGGRQAEALQAYQGARRVLVEQLGIEPGAQLRRLHERILAGDEPEPATPVPTGESATSTGVHAEQPRQLPAAPGYFTGRTAELEWLTGLPERGAPAGDTVVISAIDGMAGIGKTALAVHAARRLSERFPDGQLFLDLHGYTQGHPPREPGQALETFLRALGVPAGQIPQDIEERAALYRQRLTGTRTLIVLDNAHNEAQVRPLVPGEPGCLVLVTSRRRLKGLDDARSLTLDLLPPRDAVALLRAVAGAERIAPGDPLLGEVAELCGRLPLALRIGGALVRHRPAWSLRHLAGLLRDLQDRVRALSDGERDLAAVFDLSYTGLDEPHRLLFRRLGLVPGPDTDAYAAAALLACDPDGATVLLEDLVDHNLLLSPTAGRYRLHDLLRAHARTRAAGDVAIDREAAVGRLLDYYQHTAARADARIARSQRAAPVGPVPAHAPALDDPEAALAWLRAERPDLRACLDYAADRSWDDRVIALSAGIAGLLYTDGPWTEALRIHTRAAAVAERVNDRPAQATALLELGILRRVSGDFPRATQAIEAAFALRRDLDDPRGQADVVRQRGILRYGSGDHPGAEQDLEAALELYGDLGDRRGQANCLTHLGTVRLVTGDYPRAVRDLEAALDLHRTHGDRNGQADALIQLGAVRQMTGDYPRAVRDLEVALDLHRGLRDRRGQAGALRLLGACRQAVGDLSGAVRNLEAAIVLCRDVGDRPGLAGATANLGTVRRTIGDYPGAARDLQAALAMSREMGDPGSDAWVLNQYAAVFADTGDPSRALTLYRDALRLSREVHQANDEAIALEGIGECHLLAGEPEAGATHLAQALEIFERLGMNPDAERVRTHLKSNVST